MNRITWLLVAVSLVILVAPLVLDAAEADRRNWAIKAETPQALLELYNLAVSQKDWRTCFLCDDPELRGEFFHRMMFAAAVGKDAELGAILGKWLQWDMKRPDGNFPKIREDDRVPDGVLWYEAFRKRVDDLPGFATALARRADAMGDPVFRPRSEPKEIKIKGIGPWIRVARSRWVEGRCRRKIVRCTAGRFCARQAQRCSTIGRGRRARNRMAPPGAFPQNRQQLEFRAIRPSAVAGAAKILRKEVKSFFVTLSCNNQGISKQYLELRFRVRPYEGGSGPGIREVTLTEQQANRLIDYLAKEGHLRQAVELGKQKIQRVVVTGKWYTLQVSTRNLQLHEDLGWGLAMLKRLQGLRGAGGRRRGSHE